MDVTARRARFIYEAARLEAIASERPIVPWPLDLRDAAFVEQFLKTVARVCTEGYETTPEREHQSWREAYERMGWSYGPVRDVGLKLHPDMVPFDRLPKLEQEQDAVFIELCAFARKWIK